MALMIGDLVPTFKDNFYVLKLIVAAATGDRSRSTPALTAAWLPPWTGSGFLAERLQLVKTQRFRNRPHRLAELR